MVLFGGGWAWSDPAKSPNPAHGPYALFTAAAAVFTASVIDNVCVCVCVAVLCRFTSPVTPVRIVRLLKRTSFLDSPRYVPRSQPKSLAESPSQSTLNFGYAMSWRGRAEVCALWCGTAPVVWQGTFLATA